MGSDCISSWSLLIFLLLIIRYGVFRMKKWNTYSIHYRTKVGWSNVLLIQSRWNPEIDIKKKKKKKKKGQNYESFFLKFETTLGRCHIINLIHWKWRLIKVSHFKTKEGLCVKDQSEIFKRWSIYNHEKSPWWKTHFLYFVLIILWVIQMLLRSNFKTKVKCE